MFARVPRWTLDSPFTPTRVPRSSAVLHRYRLDPSAGWVNRYYQVPGKRGSGAAAGLDAYTAATFGALGMTRAYLLRFSPKQAGSTSGHPPGRAGSTCWSDGTSPYAPTTCNPGRPGRNDRRPPPRSPFAPTFIDSLLRGRRTVKVVPSPGALAQLTRPPSIST